MIGEIIWLIVILIIVVWVINGVNDFNKMVNIGVAKLAEKERDERWTPASELLGEMDEKEQKLNEENKEEESDEGDDDFAMVGL